MKRGFWLGICLIVTTTLLVTCGDSPSSPESTLTAPAIQSPAVGARVDTLNPTLVVGNAIGGTGEPTYRFEIATDSSFNQKIAEVEGVGQGSGSTSWKVPGSLDAARTYFWRSQASASGETGPWSQVANFETAGGFFAERPGSDGILVFDPLTNGSTVGQRGGGSFGERGWKATSALSYIRYQVRTLTNGFVEFDVTNLRNPNPHPRKKRNLMIMWDPTAGEYTTNPYRMHLAKFDTWLVNRWHVRLRFISQGQENNTGINKFDWNPHRVYHWRVEWGAFPNIVSTQRVQVLLDGAQIMSRNYDPIYNPNVHWIELGMAPREESLEQAIYSNVAIGVRRP